MSKKVYIISGLGADERMFRNLDFGVFKPNFINWIKPFKNEEIKGYAQRLRTQITEDNPIIIGLSFGGMVAVEISKQIKTKRIILISSAETRNDLPSLYRIAGKLKLNQLMPKLIYSKSNFLTNWLFGAKTREDKSLLKQVLKDTDLDFAQWAIHQLINWANIENPHNAIRIHGDSDLLLPKKVLEPNIKLKNGTHLMVLNQAEEVSLALQKILN